jgi:hypothetical protein
MRLGQFAKQIQDMRTISPLIFNCVHFDLTWPIGSLAWHSPIDGLNVITQDQLLDNVYSEKPLEDLLDNLLLDR